MNASAVCEHYLQGPWYVHGTTACMTCSEPTALQVQVCKQRLTKLQVSESCAYCLLQVLSEHVLTHLAAQQPDHLHACHIQQHVREN